MGMAITLHTKSVVLPMPSKMTTWSLELNWRRTASMSATVRDTLILAPSTWNPAHLIGDFYCS